MADYPIGPVTAPHRGIPRGMGGGFVLSGYKTYIVALATALFGFVLAHAAPHLGPGATQWMIDHKDAIIAWLAAAGLSTLRAAVAKLMAYFNAIQTGQNPPGGATP